MKINQREIIVYAMMEIMDEKKYNNIVLKQTLAKNNALDRTQKAFITECVNGTLRNLIHIDYIINFYSNTKTKKMKPLILNILRTSIYQLKYMDKVPDSAICNEAVNLAKEKGFKNLGGFVNGVLRNIIRNEPEIKYPNKKKNPLDYLSVMYSVPKWILEYWQSEFTIEVIEKICKMQNKNPYVSVAVNTLKTSKEELIKIFEKEGIEVSDRGLLENSLQIKKTADITKKDSYLNGLFHVMDESSMLAVDAMLIKEYETLFDMCAAPGGKSFYASYKSNDKSFIKSFDIHEHKIELIRLGAKRLSIKNIEASISDATILDEDKIKKADKVLVDAPCSGLGMLRKKPDIKYTKSMEDIDELVKIQREILKTSSKYVKDGGTLIYSTCTISKKENIDNVIWFLNNFDFELEDLKDFLPSKINVTSKYIQLLPFEYDTDGFFIARFKRKG